jgi:hypothetical protein
VTPGPGRERTSGCGFDGPGFDDEEGAAPPGVFDRGGGETSFLEGLGFDGGDTSSLFEDVGWGEGDSGRLRRNRPISLMADIGRFDVCSGPGLPVLAGDDEAGFVVPMGVDGVFVCDAGLFACVSCAVPSDEFEIDEAFASALNAFSAASRSAFCCRRILSTRVE